MLNWLSSWLQQIIAVVLLAGLIDLLLPNKAMQRYVRLVAGLIILLTIMSPIIRLLQGDFNAKLDQDVEGWFQGVKDKDIRMPTLEDIQKDADVMKKNQQTSALTLTEKKLSEEMRQKIEQRTGREVEAVALQLQVVTTGVTEGASSSPSRSQCQPCRFLRYQLVNLLLKRLAVIHKRKRFRR